MVEECPNSGRTSSPDPAAFRRWTGEASAPTHRVHWWVTGARFLGRAPDNHASRRVIERNGGVFADLSAAGRLRFRCPAG
ncbi:hypothetical protein Amsp01_000180 [Amycolatopsis sp. NBRC 101858]|nr:hypothetical protein Amsp01_000180 [Amycolatopsis sp. NBRC 101858]